MSDIKTNPIKLHQLAVMRHAYGAEAHPRDLGLHFNCTTKDIGDCLEGDILVPFTRAVVQAVDAILREEPDLTVQPLCSTWQHAFERYVETIGINKGALALSTINKKAYSSPLINGMWLSYLCNMGIRGARPIGIFDLTDAASCLNTYAKRVGVWAKLDQETPMQDAPYQILLYKKE